MQQSKEKLLNANNSKLKKTGKQENVRILDFSLPAYKDKKTNKVTCPMANECLKFCYAKKGFFQFPSVQESYSINYQETKNITFVDKINSQLFKLKKDKPVYVRIHSSGDFYSKAYLAKWVQIAKDNSNVIFYGYTKSVKMLKATNLPGNMLITYSFGGKQDNLIDVNKDSHSVVFDSLEELQSKGYANGSDNDLVMTRNNKLGLVIH